MEIPPTEPDKRDRLLPVITMLLGLSAEDEGRISKGINALTDPESVTGFSVRKRMGLR